MEAPARIEEAPRRSLLVDMAERYGMDPKPFEQTVIQTVFRDGAPSREEFAAFLLLAKEYKLNPLTKEVHAFKSRGRVQAIVGVDGWCTLVNSHPQADGFDFEDHLDNDGAIAAVTCRMYRKDRSHAITATEYLAECRRKTDTWQQWPRRMLRHKALIQAARYAFGFAGVIDPDEAERIREAEVEVRDVAPAISSPEAAEMRASRTELLRKIAERRARVGVGPFRRAMRAIECEGFPLDRMSIPNLEDLAAELEIEGYRSSRGIEAEIASSALAGAGARDNEPIEDDEVVDEPGEEAVR